jgi:hypothetical protein
MGRGTSEFAAQASSSDSKATAFCSWLPPEAGCRASRRAPTACLGFASIRRHRESASKRTFPSETARQPIRVAGYESREAITRSGGTRRAETVMRRARRSILASASVGRSPQHHATTTSLKPTPQSGTRTASWCSLRQPTMRFGRMSPSAIRRFNSRTACQRAAAWTSGINRCLEATTVSWATCA